MGGLAGKLCREQVRRGSLEEQVHALKRCLQNNNDNRKNNNNNNNTNKSDSNEGIYCGTNVWINNGYDSGDGADNNNKNNNNKNNNYNNNNSNNDTAAKEISYLSQIQELKEKIECLEKVMDGGFEGGLEVG